MKGSCKVLIPIILNIMVACAPIYKSITNQEFVGRTSDSSTLVIAPFTQPRIQYFGDLKDEFGEGNSRELILNHFKQALIDNFKKYSAFRNVEFDSFTNPPVFESKTFYLDKNTNFNMQIPKDAIIFSNAHPDYVLFLDDLNLGKDIKGNYFLSPGFMGGTYKSRLAYKGNFAIWGVKEKKVVTYGSVNAVVQDYDFVTIKEWNKIDRDFVIDMILNSPFEKK